MQDGDEETKGDGHDDEGDGDGLGPDGNDPSQDREVTIDGEDGGGSDTRPDTTNPAMMTTLTTALLQLVSSMDRMETRMNEVETQRARTRGDVRPRTPRWRRRRVLAHGVLRHQPRQAR